MFIPLERPASRPLKALFAAGLMALSGCTTPATTDAEPPPFTLAADLFDHSQPDTLGLAFAPGRETFTVFRATEDSNQYNHGAVVFAFKGQLYTQWQSSARDEDAPDTQVFYAISDDLGASWSEVITLAPARPDAVITNGGWWSDGDTLVAYLNVWPKDAEPRGGHVEYVTSTDGRTWSQPKPVTTASGAPLLAIMEQDLRWLDSRRILTSVHEQPGLITKPYYTDDPLAVSGWTRGEMPNLPHPPAITRELEPSWFVRSDGAAVMVFRDQGSSFRVLASVSTDRGETWSLPAFTDMIDSRAKQSAGNLPDGSVYLVNNPSGSRTRIPLTLTTSADGLHFDRAWLVRAGGEDLQPWQFEGLYKRDGYSYPKSYVHGDYLYVAYATNKEDIEVTRIPVAKLGYGAAKRAR